MSKQFVAIGGGKGGVGKSLIAANLAIAFAQTGRRTVIVDADLGGANLHTLFGIDRPEALLEHFVSRKVERLDEILIPTQQEGLHIICGGMPVLGTANPKHSQKSRLIRHIHALDFDTVVVDIGAGTAFNVLDLFNAADYKLVAFTPQLTSLHNGYGFLKAAIHRRLESVINKDIRALLQATNPETGAESMAAVLRRIAALEIDEAEKAELALENQKVFLVGNMIHSEKEKHVVGALRQMISDHLLIEAELLGAVKYGEKLERSVNERRPFMLSAGIESNAEVFRSMAARLIRLHQIAEGERRPSDADAVSHHPSEKQQKKSKSDRSEPRYPTWHLAATLKSGNTGVPGQVLNISHGGALVAFDRQPPEPASGQLAIGPGEGGIAFDVAVEERHRNKTGTRVGYSFASRNRFVERSIADLVAQAAAATAVDRISNLD